MGILSFKAVVVGLVDVKPRIIYIKTNNLPAEVVQAGFLNSIKSQLQTTDIALVSTKLTVGAFDSQTGFYNVQYAAGQWSLATASSSGTVNAGTANQLAYYAGTGDTVSGLSSAANGVLVTSAAGVPSIADTLPDAVQDNITRLGTITAIGAPLGADFGGTGVTNAATSTITLAGALETAGAFDSIFRMTAATDLTFPTAGTLATTAQLPTPAALTKADDTNVTLTLGGTPATALLQASSITAGWSGQLAVGRGGLAKSTVAQNSMLYATALDTYGEITAVNNATLVTSDSGVPSLAALTDGQIIIGSSAGAPIAANIIGGVGVTIVNANNSITVNSVPGLAWNSIAGTTQAAAVNNAYVVANASQTTVTLPATAAVGDIVRVQGLGAAGWVVQLPAGDTLQVGSSATTSGGTVTSADQWDCIEMVCVVANTTWATGFVLSSGVTIA